MNTQKTFIILHDIRSEHNVGSIFRTADAVGVSKIYLTGYTPAPLDRFEERKIQLQKQLSEQKKIFRGNKEMFLRLLRC